MAVDIEAARVLLASLYKADLVTATSLVQELYPYGHVLAGESPVSVFTTSEIDDLDTFGDIDDVTFCNADFMVVRFNLLNYVLLSDLDRSTWDVQSAETEMNRISVQTMKTTRDIKQDTVAQMYTEWERFRMETASPAPAVVDMAGTFYLRRIFTLRVSK